jgi:hypothetical protein
MKFSLLSAAGLLVSMLVVSQGQENDRKNYISMEEITEQMKKQYEEAMFEKDVGIGGLRGLQATCQQWACLEPNDDLIMTFAGRTWGSKYCMSSRFLYCITLHSMFCFSIRL